MEPFIMINIINDPVIRTGIEKIWYEATKVLDDFLVTNVLRILERFI